MSRQHQLLRDRPHIIIATPGRLNDHVQQGTANLSQVKILVLDEADHMLDMGFAPQIHRILAKLPADRQTLLFSATMAPGIVAIAKRTMKLPLQVEVTPPGTTIEAIEHEVFVVQKDQKAQLLRRVLAEYHGPILVFTRTKFITKRVTRFIRDWGERAAEIHSNRTMYQRREALDGFKKGTYRVLVATDIAARGIDVMGIALVVNYDLPAQSEGYVHRIGRTARAGRRGKAVSFVQPDQKRDLANIERLIRTKIPMGKWPAEFSHTMPIMSQNRSETSLAESRPPAAGRQRGYRTFHHRRRRRS
jgi:ATP-dependent RNA helicase RhlE